MFINISNASPLIDKFSIWLFAGTGATGSLLISQIQGVVQGLSITGFKACNGAERSKSSAVICCVFSYNALP
jgi:hypothetical protein